ncbi:hypothetical protein [Fodinibius sp.]|nr:hypothetical protein [Fodinibius sp.]MDZ7660307.1 hypothetical protein [Fodinibius sp.]
MVSDRHGARPSPNGVSAFNTDGGSPRSRKSLPRDDRSGSV